MHGNWLGFLELLIVFGFALGWGVLELVALRLDRNRETQDAIPTDDQSSRQPTEPAPERRSDGL